jgi:peptide/nickel transport system permease protein
MRDGRPAAQLVLERVPATLAITLPAFALKLCIGIPAGIYAALHRNSWADRLTMMISVAGFTVPSFVLALVLVLVFSVQLGWLPSAGSDKAHQRHPADRNPGGCRLQRSWRASRARPMLEVLGQPYIRAASAKGLAVAPRSWVVSMPCPNAAIPTTTICRHSWSAHPDCRLPWWSKPSSPGTASGRLLVSSVSNRDLAVAAVDPAAWVAATMVTSNIIVDAISMAGSHPRLRRRGARWPLTGALIWPLTARTGKSGAASSRPGRPLTLVAMAWIATDGDRGVRRRPAGAYSFTALDLRARLSPPVFMGGKWAHPLGSDELGRDVLSRLIMSIRLSLLIAFFGTSWRGASARRWASSPPTSAARSKALILMMIDFQASVPFLIVALAVLAFFGNSLVLFVMLMGLNSWSATPASPAASPCQANEQGYAAAVRQLGASNVPGLRAARAAQHRLDPDRLDDHHLSRDDPARERPVVPRASASSRRSASLGNMVGYGREYLTRAPVDHAFSRRR